MHDDTTTLSVSQYVGEEEEEESSGSRSRRGRQRRRSVRWSGRHSHLLARLLCHALRYYVNVVVAVHF